jgi:hypothetical protein
MPKAEPPLALVTRDRREPRCSHSGRTIFPGVAVQTGIWRIARPVLARRLADALDAGSLLLEAGAPSAWEAGTGGEAGRLVTAAV